MKLFLAALAFAALIASSLSVDVREISYCIVLLA